MFFTTCSHSSEFSPLFSGSISRNMILNSIVPKVLNCAGDLSKKGKFHIHSGVLQKALVSGHLEGSYTGKRQLNEPSSNLCFIRTLLIDNYDSYTYNIFQELAIINGVSPIVIHNDEWSWEELCHFLYVEKAFDNIVISPGPGSPECASDTGICLRILLECSDIPILGVCLGHQALGYVHGAQVVCAPEPIHGRLSFIDHNGCGLFKGIPSGRNSSFKVVRYHSLVIDQQSLPKEIIPIAWTTAFDTIPFLGIQNSDYYHRNFDCHLNSQLPGKSISTKSGIQLPLHSEDTQSGKILMGVMHSSRPHYGLQFHPESIATFHGKQIFKNFAEITREYWLRSKSSGTKSSQTFPRCEKHLFNGLVDEKPASLHCATNLSCMSKNVKYMKMKWRKIGCSVSQIGGAEIFFTELFGDHQHQSGNTFWLDSSSTEMSRARFSFMGGKGGQLWRQLSFRLLNKSDATKKGGGFLSIEDASGFTTSAFLEDGFFDFLNKELKSFCFNELDYEGLPFDFYGGFVGYIGYDLKVECGASTNNHKSSVPDACFFFADNLVVIDHHSDCIYITSILDNTTSETQWLDDIEQKLLNMKENPLKKFKSFASQVSQVATVGERFSVKKSREQYIDDIEKCQNFIKKGESYELCLTTQMTKKVGEINSLGLYLNLRAKNPAPYAAWLNFPGENLCICSSSPERFLRLDKSGMLEAKPIKGTIARGLTPDHDKFNKLQLQYSEKDQAENLMIVDLLRNDLGRICVPGSVHVPRLMDIESYATVHTMVSTVRGEKKSNVSAVDCVRAAFPGGSMTGAPKLRSMEILDCLENASRGIYSGCIGYFSYNQTFDLNIVIRTVVIHNGEASIGAGGAITALSNSSDEYEEMILKTKAPINAVIEYQSSTCHTPQSTSTVVEQQMG